MAGQVLDITRDCFFGLMSYLAVEYFILANLMLLCSSGRLLNPYSLSEPRHLRVSSTCALVGFDWDEVEFAFPSLLWFPGSG